MRQLSRPVNFIIIIVAVLLFSLAGLTLFHDLVFLGDRRISRLLWAFCIFAAGLCFLFALCYGNDKIKHALLFLLYIVAFCEISLQALAFCGLLPNLSFYSFVPYGRVYWSKEGNGSGFCNRYGWYYPSLALKPESKKIAVIGDSFISAHQIHCHKNFGWRLQEILREKGDKSEVLAIGQPGYGPAYYLELLKYAHRKFKIQEAIICVFVGNDFRNSSMALQPETPPSQYIYYTIGKDGELAIVPQSQQAVDRLNKTLEMNHGCLFLQLPEIIKSNCIFYQTIYIVINNFIDLIQAGKNRDSANGDNARTIDAGLNDSFYKPDISLDEKEAIEIVKAILRKCHAYAQDNSIIMRLVVIPRFTQDFYKMNSGKKDWSSQLSDKDLFIPEKILSDFAAKEGIPILPSGEVMRQNGMSSDDIKSLYTTNGRGHLSVKGHDYFAESIAAYFYGLDRLRRSH